MKSRNVKPPKTLVNVYGRFARLYVDLGIRQKMVFSAALGAVLLAGYVGLALRRRRRGA